MKKIFTLVCAVFLTLSVSSQKVDPHKHFPDRSLEKRSQDESVVSNKYYRYLPKKQESSEEIQYKNTNAVKQQLDMVYSAGMDKDEYRYDSNGRIIEDIYFEWNAGQWERISKSEYAYNLNGTKILNTDFDWDVDQWVNYMQYDDTYDADGNKTASLTYMWNGSEWENTEAKEEFTYDDKGNLSQYILAFWVGDQYMNFEKNEYSYDERGNQTQNIESNWDGAQWVTGNKSEFNYNSNDELSSVVTSEWIGDVWVTAEKFENFFDPDGNVSRSEYSFWEEEQWTLVETVNFTYDARGNMTLADAYVFDMNIYREVSVYDEYDNRSLYTFFEGDYETGQLQNSWKIESFYDNGFSFDDLILPFTPDDFKSDDDDESLDLGILFKHKLMRLVNYEGAGENWITDSEYILVYSEQNTTGVGELNSENGNYVFPNPAAGQATFSFDAAGAWFLVEIFDIHGKMVISQVSQNNKAISIEALSDGIYFYRLESAGSVLSGKLIVKN